MPSPNDPPVSRELVEWAERCWPDRCPTSDMEERKVWMAAGAAGVVRKLRSLHDQQAKNALVPRG